MRNEIQLILFLLGIWQFPFAQNVFPSFADEPSWHVVNIGYTKAQTGKIEFEKDTVICGINYSVIKMWGDTPVYVHSDTLKTIYKYKPDCNEASFILYDYSLNEGASVITEFNSQFKVLEVDSVTLFGIKRKRLKVDSYFGEMYWIEGIGSTFHPFYALMGVFADAPQNYFLLCYHEGETQYFQTDEHDGCSLEYQIPNDYFYSAIFPNPFQGKTTLSIEMLEFREVHVDIYSSLGQLIETIYSESNTFHQIDFGDRLSSNGVYFVKVRIDDSIYTTQILRWK